MDTGLAKVTQSGLQSLRRVRERWSRYTIAQLQKRIAERERYRDTFISDKAIYLGIFRITLVMLVSISAGGAVLVLEDTCRRFRLSLLARFHCSIFGLCSFLV